MITAVCMNPCIDLTLNIPYLTQGGSHRVTYTRRDVCGKAVNVAMALKNLNCECRLTGINFKENGEILIKMLDREKIPHDFITAAGSIRTNVKIFEEERRIMTEINQNGDTVSDAVMSDVLEKVAGSRSGLLILSGSLPPGAANDIYAKMISRFQENYGGGATVILDTDGERLRMGIETGANVIKPNLSEMECTFGVKLPTRGEQLEFCKKLINKYHGRGLRVICLSLGEEGALAVDSDGAYYAAPLNIPVRGVQGAGDAMVAGMAVGIIGKAPTETLLKYAMASAAASLVREGTQMGKLADFNAMLPRANIEKI